MSFCRLDIQKLDFMNNRNTFFKHRQLKPLIMINRGKVLKILKNIQWLRNISKICANSQSNFHIDFKRQVQ